MYGHIITVRTLIIGDEMKALKLNGFNTPVWDEYAGANGAYVAESTDGKIDAIAEPENGGFMCFFVDTSNGATLKQEFISV